MAKPDTIPDYPKNHEWKQDGRTYLTHRAARSRGFTPKSLSKYRINGHPALEGRPIDTIEVQFRSEKKGGQIVYHVYTLYSASDLDLIDSFFAKTLCGPIPVWNGWWAKRSRNHDSPCVQFWKPAKPAKPIRKRGRPKANGKILLADLFDQIAILAPRMLLSTVDSWSRPGKKCPFTGETLKVEKLDGPTCKMNAIATELGEKILIGVDKAARGWDIAAKVAYVAPEFAKEYFRLGARRTPASMTLQNHIKRSIPGHYFDRHAKLQPGRLYRLDDIQQRFGSRKPLPSDLINALAAAVSGAAHPGIAIRASLASTPPVSMQAKSRVADGGDETGPKSNRGRRESPISRILGRLCYWLMAEDGGQVKLERIAENLKKIDPEKKTQLNRKWITSNVSNFAFRFSQRHGKPWPVPGRGKKGPFPR